VQLGQKRFMGGLWSDRMMDEDEPIRVDEG
jgi:hypothetical protein